MSALFPLRRPNIPTRAFLSLTTSFALALAPALSRDARAQDNPPPRVQEKEPTFNGVGLIVIGSLLGSAAVYPTLFGGFTWAFSDSDGATLHDPELGPVAPTDDLHQTGRRLFFIGAAGLLVSGAMIFGGIALNQRHARWKERSLRARMSLRPQYLWSGRTHSLGLSGRF